MNLPNQLTVGRLILTFIFVVLAAVPSDYPNSLLLWKIGYVISIVAGFTDFFDGYLARKYQLITTFGQLMDPLADKIFTVSAFVVLTAHRCVPFWVTILILTREFAVTGLRTLAANRGLVLSASKLGKYKTVAQMLVLLVGGSIWVEWIPSSKEIIWVWKALLYLLAIFTIYSGAEYFVKNKRLYLEEV